MNEHPGAGATASGQMPRFWSLLYREPRLYDLVFGDTDETTERMLRTAIGRYLPGVPQSVLDIGCGTGRHLEAMARTIAECWGVDLLESNVAYARSVRAGVTFQTGDMRTVRLGRTFDFVTCLGNTLSYALTDQDLTDTASTFAAHAHSGTLLVVDLLNARAYLEGGRFEERIEGHVHTPEFRATSVARHELDRRARVLKRTRTWHISDQADVEDYAEYRVLLPEEIQQILEAAGFQVRAMYDNRDFKPTDLAGRITAVPDAGGMRGRKLYVFARKE